MNDLLPPARRSIPKQRMERMRKLLDDEIGRPTALPRAGVAKRVGVPALVAAASAALAVGGYLVANVGDDAGRGADPAGEGGLTTRQQTTKATMDRPEQAYQECIKLVVGQFAQRGQPVGERPTGKLAIDNGKGITVVVANSTDAYTCNIKPDRAVSNAAPLDGKAQAKDFRFARNGGPPISGTKNGEIAWAGGEVPNGVTAISYAFPDGHTEQATVQNGFWAMQYLSDKPIARGLDWQVNVTLTGPNGRTITLDYTDGCNQVTHGC